MPAKKIAILVGSLRQESLSRKFAHALLALAPASLECVTVDLGELPLYNQDLDDGGSPPAAWSAFRAQVAACDGVLVVTPEHNRSMPAAVKNAIDVGSRPPGKSVWSGKPGGVLTLSPGAMGGFGAAHHLRQSLVAVNVATMAGPEVYIGNAAKLLDADGQVNNEHTRETLQKFITAFAAWVHKNGA